MNEFKQRPELGGQQAPLLFWLLVGFFRHRHYETKRFFTTGLFRVTSSDSKVRELETHMSQGNYAFLEKKDANGKCLDPNIVANYLKRVLRQMREPLIPERQFEKLGNLD